MLKNYWHSLRIPFLLSSVLSIKVAWWQCSGIAFSKKVQVRKLLFARESHFHLAATNNNLQNYSLSVLNDLLRLLLPLKLTVGQHNWYFPFNWEPAVSVRHVCPGWGEESWVPEQGTQAVDSSPALLPIWLHMHHQIMQFQDLGWAEVWRWRLVLLPSIPTMSCVLYWTRAACKRSSLKLAEKTPTSCPTTATESCLLTEMMLENQQP